MKSQDILVLFKILCVTRAAAGELLPHPAAAQQHAGWSDETWEGGDSWEAGQLRQIDTLNEAEKQREYLFSVRGLSASLGISKSEINNCITRCLNVNLAKISRINQRIEVNKKTLFNFIRYGLRLVFPVKPAELTRGIPTTFSAPVLQGSLYSAGDFMLVWPDPLGKEMGLSIAPLYKSVPFAVRQDPELYACLALLDAVRIGNPREMKLALEKLEDKLFNDNV